MEGPEKDCILPFFLTCWTVDFLWIPKPPWNFLYSFIFILFSSSSLANVSSLSLGAKRFCFFFFIQKDRFLSLRATCTTTTPPFAHAKGTSRHGAIFLSKDTQRYHFGSRDRAKAERGEGRWQDGFFESFVITFFCSAR